jgi:hypothetical protein
MLSALGSETDRLAGLELGADDYVTKPFSPRELVLRVQSVLRRAAAPLPTNARAASVVVDGDLRVDLRAHEAWRGGLPLALTVREYDLLVYLLANAGQAFSREHLLRNVWGWEFGDNSTVTVHVRRLREKIEPDPRHPTAVITVFGIGYRYELGRDPGQGPRRHHGDRRRHVAGCRRRGPVAPQAVRHRSLQVSAVLIALVPVAAVLAGALTSAQPCSSPVTTCACWSSSP